MDGELFLAIGDCNDDVDVNDDVDDNDPLFHNLCQHPLAGFTFASKNMPKGVGRFSFSASATYL